MSPILWEPRGLELSFADYCLNLPICFFGDEPRRNRLEASLLYELSAMFESSDFKYYLIYIYW